MSVRLANVDLSTLSTTNPTTVDTQGITIAQCGWIEFLNESAYLVELTLGGMNIPIPAWTGYPVQLQQKGNQGWSVLNSFNFPPNILPTMLPANQTNQSSQLITTLYMTGETPASTVPYPLIRQAFVPNNVNTVGGAGTMFVQDDNRTPGLLTLEATPSGAGSSQASVSNQGVGFMSGSWRFASTIEVDLGILANLITALTGNDIGFHVASGQRVVATINGIDVFSINSSGANLLAGKINLLAGSLSRRSTFSATLTTTPKTYNHNLGAVPDWVGITVIGTSTTGVSVKVSNITSTTIDLVSTVDSTSVLVMCTA